VREVVLLLQQARTRNSTLWADDPKQQLAYLGVKRWARLYTPDVILGVYSVDELEEREINPDFTSPGPDSGNKSATESLAARAAAKRAEQQATVAAKGTVIDGEAEPVAETIQQDPAPVPEEVIDPDIADKLADALFKLDISESAEELKLSISEITALGSKLTDFQKAEASAVYRKNLERLGLNKKRAA
jgi:hypothetical protein